MIDCNDRWICPECNNLNYPWYKECIACKCPKPECVKNDRD